MESDYHKNPPHSKYWRVGFSSLKILAGGRGTCHTFLTRPGPTWPQQITFHLFNVAKMWKPRKRAHKLFVFDDSRTDYRTKCFCTQKINLVKCGGNGSSHTKNHISLIALQCSIQIAMLTPRPFTILCVPIHTLYKCIFMRGTGCKNFIYGPSWMHEGLTRGGFG